MVKLQSIIIKENYHEHVENIDIILEHFHSVLGLSDDLIKLGHNRNLKIKPGKFYDGCCIYIVQMVNIAECLRRLPCNHRFHINCVNR